MPLLSLDEGRRSTQIFEAQKGRKRLAAEIAEIDVELNRPESLRRRKAALQARLDEFDAVLTEAKAAGIRV